MKTKKCKTCGKEKPLEDFSAVRNIEPDKKVLNCKPCVAAKCREYYHKTHPNARTKQEIAANAGRPKLKPLSEIQRNVDALYGAAMDAFNILVK